MTNRTLMAIAIAAALALTSPLSLQAEQLGTTNKMPAPINEEHAQAGVEDREGQLADNSNFTSEDALKIYPISADNGGGDGAPDRAIPPIMRSGFDRAAFEEFIDARIGSGEPVYWYGMGVINSYPDGETLARIEGVDLGKLYRPNPDEPEAYMITRKFAVFRHPDTAELLRDETGKIRFIGYNYQYFKWTLEGDDLRYEIESGSRDKLKTTVGTGGNEIRRMGDLTIITTPVPIDSPVVQAWEKYDFLVMPEGSAEPRYQTVWGKYTPNFSWMPEGFSTMHSWLYRYNAYQDLPQSIRTIIETEPGMDLWREPPKDVAQIRKLQQSGENYR